MEYTAQCWGGPEHGNLISSREESWGYKETVEMMLDGPTGPAIRNVTVGKYVYKFREGLDGGAGAYVWEWFGPGADGDTIERLRLR